MTEDNLSSSDGGIGAGGIEADPTLLFGVPRGDALMESARVGSGIATVYEALDRLCDLYALDDAALVVDVPGFGRQVLHAGRKPLGNDEHGFLRSPPGLYLEPPLDDPVLHDLMQTVGALGLRLDTRMPAEA